MCERIGSGMNGEDDDDNNDIEYTEYGTHSVEQ